MVTSQLPEPFFFLAFVLCGYAYFFFLNKVELIGQYKVLFATPG